ncbi:hypothetical protein KDK_18260 [Dictyobacter kobayashii]|uniref:Uncharacterized protein n=1 Tax=Dictyobacter kobayashii TaxID=2014872 RepID=A0A402AG10_9CHLR|nr:hypothetical protein KDK_18260 [Dictyobacter kobayashii]
MGGQSAFNAGAPYGGNAYSTSGSAAPSNSADSAGEQKNKKRGLFEAIREWLSR